MNLWSWPPGSDGTYAAVAEQAYFVAGAGSLSGRQRAGRRAALGRASAWRPALLGDCARRSPGLSV